MHMDSNTYYHKCYHLAQYQIERYTVARSLHNRQMHAVYTIYSTTMSINLHYKIPLTLANNTNNTSASSPSSIPCPLSAKIHYNTTRQCTIGIDNDVDPHRFKLFTAVCLLVAPHSRVRFHHQRPPRRRRLRAS